MNGKHILPALALLFSVCLTSCVDRLVTRMTDNALEEPADTTGFETRRIAGGTFDRVECSAYAIVTYHPTAAGDTPHATLRGNAATLRNTEAAIADGKLEIETKKDRDLHKEDMALIDIYAPGIRRFDLEGLERLRLGKYVSALPLEINLDGAGSVEADSLHAPSLSIDLDGAGNIDVRGLQTNELRVSLDGAGHITLAGTCGGGAISLDGAGSLDVSKLRSTRTLRKEVNGAGHIRE